MNYSDFKGKKISRLGFGTMRLPMSADGTINPDAVQEMVDAALAGGVNYFDTAYGYHSGQSENYTGRALSKHPRESFYLADKMPHWLCKEPADVPRYFEEQLEKCGVDYFDFYLIHDVEEDSWEHVKSVKVLPQLLAEKEAGRIHHLGMSVHCSPKDLRTMLTEADGALEFIQLQINYYDWEYDCARGIYDVAREFDIPIIIMEPVRGGMLAKPMSDEAKAILDEGAGPATCRPDGSAGADYAAYALRFCDELPGILTTLSGMSSLEQVEDNMRIFSGPALTDGERAAMDKAVKALYSDIIIPCTGCNYCSGCPEGINIAGLFEKYNWAAAKGFHHIWGSLSGEYNATQPNAKACIQCGACETSCPQNLPIMELLQTIDAKYAELEVIGE